MPYSTNNSTDDFQRIFWVVVLIIVNFVLWGSLIWEWLHG